MKEPVHPVSIPISTNEHNKPLDKFKPLRQEESKDANSLPQVKFLTETDSLADSMIPDFLDNMDSL